MWTELLLAMVGVPAWPPDCGGKLLQALLVSPELFVGAGFLSMSPSKRSRGEVYMLADLTCYSQLCWSLLGGISGTVFMVTSISGLHVGPGGLLTL